jgi:hypothetical protein
MLLAGYLRDSRRYVPAESRGVRLPANTTISRHRNDGRDPSPARSASALRDLEADLLAFELGAVEELDGTLGLVGVDLDE